MSLCPVVYGLMPMLPSEERYAMGDQMRRAVVSVPANIAEGHARQHTREFLQHLSVASGSLAELETLLEIAMALNYIEPATAGKAGAHIAELLCLARDPARLRRATRLRPPQAACGLGWGFAHGANGATPA